VLRLARRVDATKSLQERRPHETLGVVFIPRRPVENSRTAHVGGGGHESVHGLILPDLATPR
jgi:hypothetical protein